MAGDSLAVMRAALWLVGWMQTFRDWTVTCAALSICWCNAASLNRCLLPGFSKTYVDGGQPTSRYFLEGKKPAGFVPFFFRPLWSVTRLTIPKRRASALRRRCGEVAERLRRAYVELGERLRPGLLFSRIFSSITPLLFPQRANS